MVEKLPVEQRACVVLCYCTCGESCKHIMVEVNAYFMSCILSFSLCTPEANFVPFG